MEMNVLDSSPVWEGVLTQTHTRRNKDTPLIRCHKRVPSPLSSHTSRREYFDELPSGTDRPFSPTPDLQSEKREGASARGAIISEFQPDQ